MKGKGRYTLWQFIDR